MSISKKDLITAVWVFFMAAVIFALTSCTPDPRTIADAQQTDAETYAASELAAQELAQKKILDGIVVDDAKREQLVKEAALENEKYIATVRSLWTGMATTVVLVSLLISAGAGGSIAIVGMGKAAANKALVTSNLIYLDKTTGQFPQLITYVSKGVYSLTDLNDHSTLLLDTRNEADRLAVQGAMAIRHALVMSNAAARSRDAAGVALVAPLIIEQNSEVS